MTVPLKDGKIKIICPYCFEEFAHDEVHFRLESWFDADSRDPAHMLDPAGEGRTPQEIQNDKSATEAQRKADYDEYRRRERYSKRQSDQYRKFWATYTGTTETASHEEANLGLQPWERPILPAGALSNHKFANIQGPFLGLAPPTLPFLLKATDAFGAETKRRVCPKCHNALHGNYGMYPVHFISVIGASGSGKTVYIAQLLNRLATYTKRAGITAGASNCGRYVLEYVEKNSVAMHKPVPHPTQPKDFVQPMLYQLDQLKNGRRMTNMVVIYDIAGENVEGKDGNIDGMEKFGQFIFKSHAILLLIGPESFLKRAGPEGGVLAVDTDTVATIIGQNYLSLAGETTRDGLIPKPFAICVSKSDKDSIRERLLKDQALEKIDGTRRTPGEFDAESYNPLQSRLSEFFQEECDSLVTTLNTFYSNYNFFAFTAQGVDVEEMEIDGATYKVLKSHPNPKRVEEPFMWILHKLGFIGTNAKINDPPYPKPLSWTCPKCGEELPMTQSFHKHGIKKTFRPV